MFWHMHLNRLVLSDEHFSVFILNFITKDQQFSIYFSWGWGAVRDQKNTSFFEAYNFFCINNVPMGYQFSQLKSSELFWESMSLAMSLSGSKEFSLMKNI